MRTTLELVYRYRQLMGRCEAGLGLDLDSIDALTTIEALFDPENRASDQLAGERGVLEATMRNESLHDRVAVVSLRPTGCTCRQAPYADEGEIVELVIEDAEKALSYRFKARVSWLRDDVNDNFALDLAFIGVPVLVHHGRSRDSRTSVGHRIAA